MIARSLRPLIPLLTLVLGNLPHASQAQSAYTMTVLSKPANVDPVYYAPREIDDKGVVRGVSFERAGYTLNFSYRVLYTYSPRPVTWAASTSAAVAPTLGGKKFLPAFSNGQDMIVGEIISRSFAINGVLPLYDEPRFSGYLGAGAVRQGAVDTPFPTDPKFVPTAISNSGLIVGTISPLPPAVGSKPAQWRQGVVSTLETIDQAYASPTSVNDAGIIVGNLGKVVLGPPDALGTPSKTYVTRPVMWTNGRLTELAVPAEMGVSAEAQHINNVGQVLIQTSDGGPALWFNGTTTPLKLVPRISSLLQLEGPNDAGTIAGCEKAGTATWPFLWKNGTQIDLAQELSSKGINPPAGYTWGCPVAINNAGSMIMYYWKPLADPLQVNSSVVWVRINAKP